MSPCVSLCLFTGRYVNCQSNVHVKQPINEREATFLPTNNTEILMLETYGHNNGSNMFAITALNYDVLV